MVTKSKLETYANAVESAGIEKASWNKGDKGSFKLRIQDVKTSDIGYVTQRVSDAIYGIGINGIVKSNYDETKKILEFEYNPSEIKGATGPSHHSSYRGVLPKPPRDFNISF